MMNQLGNISGGRLVASEGDVGLATLIHYEYHRPGKPTARFDQWLVLDRPDAKVLLTERYDGPEITMSGRVVQATGGSMIWFVFPGKWHDIGRFHLDDGSFTGWYTNLIRPVEISGERWTGHDLFLDLWQGAGGEHHWLDVDELEEAHRTHLIDALTRKRVLNEQTMIDLQVRMNAWPPPIARDIDLAQARALRGS